MTATSQRRQTVVVGRLSNVDKWYGNRQVLNGISLEIQTTRSSHCSVAVAVASRRYCVCWQVFRQTTPASVRSSVHRQWLSRSPDCSHGVTFSPT
ncbi:MAG: sulfonate transport system ATP-binding protein [Mycobacterium sp.]|nr:sulfonate transport system ATP-binding protein [Mycobacterium sp.]